MEKNDNVINMNQHNVNINDIFDKRIELGPLLHFNILQKVIEELINRQNKEDEKIKKLEDKIIDIKLFNKTKDNVVNDNMQQIEVDKNENNNNKNKENDLLLQNQLNQQNMLVNKLNLKIGQLESQYNELLTNLNTSNKQSMKELNILKSKMNIYDENFNKQEEMYNKLSEQVSEINIYDVFKGNNDNVNVDNATVLIKGIEQKLLKKIEFVDSRNKSNQEMMTKFNEQINNIQKKLDNFSFQKEEHKTENEIKNDENKNNKNVELLDKINFDKYITKEEMKKVINEQNKKINEISKNKAKEDNSEQNILESLNKKINKINEEINTSLEKMREKTDRKFQMQENNLFSLQEDILQINQEMRTKITKQNLGSIYLKLEDIQIVQDNLKLNFNENKNNIQICNEKISKNISTIENLNGILLNLIENEKNRKEKEDEIDLSIYITKEIFDKEINGIYKKMEKIINIQTDNYRSIQSQEETMKHFATEKDMKNLEQYLINLMKESKLNLAKKFVDKIDYQRAYKYMELQIKTLQDANSKDSNSNNNDNWLLAKKPMNNYMCASCESYIGDLKNNEEHLSWNKIENKRYRFGHGFSTLLKMVNNDIIKRVKRINSGLNVGLSLEDYKKMNIKRLPKLNVLKNLNNSEVQCNLVEEVTTEKLYNSSDNIDNNQEGMNEKTERNEVSKKMVDECSNTKLSKSYLGFTENHIEETENGGPKVLKIYKKLKNS